MCKLRICSNCIEPTNDQLEAGRMNRRDWIAGVSTGMALAPTMVFAQGPSTKIIPTRTALAQVGLERHWFNAVPLSRGSSRVAAMNLAGKYLFAQTTDGLIACYDAESGKRFWTHDLHALTLKPSNISINENLAVATVGQKIVGIDLATGTQIWQSKLEDICTGGTAVNSVIAIAALANGKVQVFNVKAPGVDTCGDRHNALTCPRLKPSVGSYIYAWKTAKTISAKPLLTEKLMGFASQDGKFYMASLGQRKIVHRVATKGAIRGNMGLYGKSQVIVGSEDQKIYSINLFEPEDNDTNWILPTKSPVDHAVLVAGDDAYTVSKDGTFHAIDAKSGTMKWEMPIGESKLLAITPTRLYGITEDGAIAVVNRADGQITVTPEQSFHSFGLDFRNYSARMSNDTNDRLYMATEDGILLCLRELGKTSPTPLRDPKLPGFAMTPSEIEKLNNPDQNQGTGAAAPNAEKGTKNVNAETLDAGKNDIP
jgi:outer membrane protein assembly factor BamB